MTYICLAGDWQPTELVEWAVQTLDRIGVRVMLPDEVREKLALKVYA